MQDCFGNATDKFGGKHCSGSDFTKWGTMVDDKVKSWLATPQAKKSGHAAFISACYFHCGSHPTFGIVKCARHLSVTLAYLRQCPLLACVRHACVFAQTYCSSCGASSRRDNGNGLTGAEAFAKWMVDPTTHLWDTEKPWNYTTGCGAVNTPGPEKRGMNEDDTLKK